MANTRVTRVQTEVAGSTTGMKLRVTSVQAEVASIKTGNFARLYSIDLNTLIESDAGIIYELTASDVLLLIQSASVELVPAPAFNSGTIWAGSIF